MPTTTPTRAGSRGSGRSAACAQRSSAAATSSRVARQSGTPHQSLMRPSFFTSPPRWTFRSDTSKRSIWEMPETPVTSPDQNVSRSGPMGVTAPAAAIAIRSGAATRRAPGV